MYKWNQYFNLIYTVISDDGTSVWLMKMVAAVNKRWDQDKRGSAEAHKTNTEQGGGETGDLKQPWFSEPAELRIDKDCLVKKKKKKNPV